jgi:hypothetical protein
VIKRLEAKSMLIDLAHASRPLIDDVLGMATLLVSHTGVEGTCTVPATSATNTCRGTAATGDRHIGYWGNRRLRHLGQLLSKAIRYKRRQS